MRPSLTKEMMVKDFTNFYWLKEELQAFCREHGMSSSGSKLELTKRIETFLTTGERTKPARKSNNQKRAALSADLSLDTVITENHRCSQQARAFFNEVIGPTFHFSTYIQTYFKENVGKTYRDAVAAWYEEEKRKKQPTYKNEIAPQFEYNQFIRDFFADPKNKGKSRAVAIESWNIIKNLPGSNKYISK